jgi:hypothetical protein
MSSFLLYQASIPVDVLRISRCICTNINGRGSDRRFHAPKSGFSPARRAGTLEAVAVHVPPQRPLPPFITICDKRQEASSQCMCRPNGHSHRTGTEYSNFDLNVAVHVPPQRPLPPQVLALQQRAGESWRVTPSASPSSAGQDQLAGATSSSISSARKTVTSSLASLPIRSSFIRANRFSSFCIACL